MYRTVQQPYVISAIWMRFNKMMQEASNNFDPIRDELQQTEAIPFNIDDDNNGQGNEKPNPFEQRNLQYTRLLTNYSNSYDERHKIKMDLKKCFFRVVMMSYVAVTISALVLMFVALFKAPNAISLIVGSVATLITAIIGIPTIIANNLFPKDEDSNIVNMVKEMFKFDKDYSENLKSAVKSVKEKENSNTKTNGKTKKRS